MKYIDADKLIAEIDSRKNQFRLACCDSAFSNKERREMIVASEELDRVYSIIKRLQQEQPEESIAKEAIQLVFEEKLTPFKDGNQWSFLLGPNIQEGVCGFGDTILDAAIDFYKDYSTTRIHIGELKKTMEKPKVEEELVNYFGAMPDDKDKIALARHFYELGLNAKNSTNE